ncbi:response regulator [Hugenholtzia roseola]|uniref:response regulator n=1 Tax=Hugenholtzia roseola TaxID=1002 RepID=UPI000409CEA0|nr:response regulator [Hugenholtzia roseola]
MAAKKYYAVMLVDDSEIDNLINQKMIQSANICDVIYVHSGAKSAIEALRNLEKIAKDVPSKILPDVIFLDIDMPLMDGLQFLDQFATLLPQTQQHCRIVMLTSSINPKDMTRSKKYDFVKEYINKPLSKDVLQKLDV